MRYWPETATAVAVRLSDEGILEVEAPYGLTDLFGLRCRLGSAIHFSALKHDYTKTVTFNKRFARLSGVELLA
ncbi:MAG: nucleotidyltransferase family protein [Chakrabartia sp.]